MKENPFASETKTAYTSTLSMTAILVITRDKENPSCGSGAPQYHLSPCGSTGDDGAAWAVMIEGGGRYRCRCRNDRSRRRCPMAVRIVDRRDLRNPCPDLHRHLDLELPVCCSAILCSFACLPLWVRHRYPACKPKNHQLLHQGLRFFAYARGTLQATLRSVYR